MKRDPEKTPAEARMEAPATIEGFHDPVSGTVTYLCADPRTKAAAIVDPVLGFDLRSGSTDTAAADRLAAAVEAQGLRVERILETHAHADHLSAAAYLQRRLGGRIGIGARIHEVQGTFGQLYHLGPDFRPDGSAFDDLFQDGETFPIGTVEVRALWVPGHTPADVAYVVGGADVLVGDTLFMPAAGTARCDFPGGDAATLYRSIRRLLELPPATRLHVCHNYPADGETTQWQTTVAAQRAGNIHVRDGIDEAAFVAMRNTRDATLAMPALMLPAIQVNIRAGTLPAPEANGIAYLKIPLDAFGPGVQPG